MSYSASPDVTYRIAIGDAASRAYGSVLNNFRLAAAFAWLPLAIVLGMEVIGMIVVTVKICLGILAGVAVVALIAMPAPFWLKILIWALGALAIVILSPRF